MKCSFRVKGKRKCLSLLVSGPSSLTILMEVLYSTAMKASTGPVLPMMVRGCPAKAAYTMPHTAVAAIICFAAKRTEEGKGNVRYLLT